MSRSFKKTPVVKDHNKGEKRNANKKVKNMLKRNPEAIGQNGGFKKAYEQWEISDFSSMVSEESWRKHYYECLNSGKESDRKYASKYTIEEWMQIWEKHYKRK